MENLERRMDENQQTMEYLERTIDELSNELNGKRDSAIERSEMAFERANT